MKNQSKIFITSDTHFNHKTMIDEQWRKFKSVNEMNEFIIDRWNKTVSKEDIVYHLGDVVMNNKQDFDKNILPRLNGKIIFIRGNHCNQLMSMIDNCIISFKGKQLELVHNPFDATETIRMILHGHIHKSGKHNELRTTIQEKPYLHIKGDFVFYNCNLEYHKYKPKLLNEILGEINQIMNKYT